MEEIRDATTSVAESFGGKKAGAIARAGFTIFEYANLKRAVKEQKLAALQNDHNIAGYQYTEAIQKCFVPRRFLEYRSKNRISIRKIKAEIERKERPRNVILTGLAGSGKTTALKRLYLNCNMKGYRSLYLYARMFNKCESLADVFNAICEIVSAETECLVFFDGLDELKCLNGTAQEFETLDQFFRNNSGKGSKSPIYKFIISTRPEHFSFEQMIRNKGSRYSMDPYAIFELQELSPKESLQVCKSIEKLSQFDYDEGHYHFRDKWPSKENAKLTKAQYLHLLKQQLWYEGALKSFLSSPLLCRYAYSMMCELNSTEETVMDNSQCNKSSAIGYTLAAYIKWEFHDTNPGIQTESENGKRLLEDYKHKVLSFLTDIAGKMGTEDTIPKREWEKLKRAKKIKGNISFCALQELGEEQIAFMHGLFKDYFLASYCAKIVKNNLTRNQILEKDKFEQLTQLLSTSSLMPLMYVEHLMKGRDSFTKNILAYLLEYKAENSLEQLSKFANGRSCLIYSPDAPFSIEEYLMIFPLGSIKYYGISLNYATFCELQTTGILIIEGASDCLHCEVSRISKNIPIKGVKCEVSLETQFKHMVLDFNVVFDETVTLIGGYWSSSINRKDLHDALLSSGLRHQLEALGENPSFEAISEIYKKALVLRQLQNAKQFRKEKSVLNKWIHNVASFLGKEKNLWCLFCDGTLFVLQIVPENESELAKLFSQSLSEDSIDFIALYGNYKSVTESLDTWRPEMRFRRITQVHYEFDVTHSKPICDGNVLSTYYDIHWKNVQLLKKAHEQNSIFRFDDIENMISVQELVELYEKADSLLAQMPDEELAMYISDEKMLTLYVMGKGEEMVDLAEQTMELCKKYQHTEGISLRECLLSDHLRFRGKDLSHLYTFAKNHIWL